MDCINKRNRHKMFMELKILCLDLTSGLSRLKLKCKSIHYLLLFSVSINELESQVQTMGSTDFVKVNFELFLSIKPTLSLTWNMCANYSTSAGSYSILDASQDFHVRVDV